MSESKELTVPERAAVALGADKHEQELVALSKQYVDIVEIKNNAGRDQCHAAAMVLSKAITHTDKTGKEAREDANAFQKAVIVEAKRRIAIIEPERDRLIKLRDAWDAEREAEKIAKAVAESARITKIRTMVDELKVIPAESVGRSSSDLAATIEILEMLQVTLAEYAEFAGEAEMAKHASLAKLREMHAAQQAHEAEAARIAAEREQLARERAEAAERERQAEASRREQEAKDRAERERVEAEQRAAQEAAAAALRQQQAEHEALMAAQRAELARQQAAIDAERQRQADEAARVEREKQAAIDAEAARVAAVERQRREAEEAAARAEAQRVQAEKDAAEREQIRRIRVQFEKNGPGDDAIVARLVDAFDVDSHVVVGWLEKFNAAAFKAPKEKAA